ncbi:hypothetical protein B0H17DRAFT_39740 [Mycena rosella]|uniref:Uncharacterized protein n=1 Tax=Mycena rosella TaxID=1033263 RepID=A0AAD7M6S3_MYCRO|nr:hypothetical protein B0H17DRAFT_39740 [Mycena rosella]
MLSIVGIRRIYEFRIRTWSAPYPPAALPAYGSYSSPYPPPPYAYPDPLPNSPAYASSNSLPYAAVYADADADGGCAEEAGGAGSSAPSALSRETWLTSARNRSTNPASSRSCSPLPSGAGGAGAGSPAYGSNSSSSDDPECECECEWWLLLYDPCEAVRSSLAPLALPAQGPARVVRAREGPAAPAPVRVVLRVRVVRVRAGRGRERRDARLRAVPVPVGVVGRRAAEERRGGREEEGGGGRGRGGGGAPGAAVGCEDEVVGRLWGR